MVFAQNKFEKLPKPKYYKKYATFFIVIFTYIPEVNKQVENDQQDSLMF